jgi:hypothetical protein
VRGVHVGWVTLIAALAIVRIVRVVSRASRVASGVSRRHGDLPVLGILCRMRRRIIVPEWDWNRGAPQNERCRTGVVIETKLVRTLEL